MHNVQLHGDQAEGFQLLFHTLEFFGLCRNCQERQSA
jgi:Fur family ferric uptake transcriptional regulator